MVCLGNEQRSFCHFWNCVQVLHFGLFCWLWGYFISSKGFLPTIVDIMVIWVKFNPFQSILLIPVHWFLTCRCPLLLSPVCPLPILSWFMDLTFMFLCNIVLYSIRLYFHRQSQLGVVFALTLSLPSFWSYFIFHSFIFILSGVSLSEKSLRVPNVLPMMEVLANAAW